MPGHKTPGHVNFNARPPYQLRRALHDNRRCSRKTALKLGELGSRHFQLGAGGTAGRAFGIFLQDVARLMNWRAPRHNANFLRSLLISDRL
jgi:hypothetical protein